MRQQRERLGVILFWLLMLCTFLISVFRKQPTISAPSPNRTDIDHAAQKQRSSQPDTTHREPLVDSGMIEVALVIATLGFLLFEFGKKLNVPQSLGDLTLEQIGKIIVFAGIAAAFLLHTTFWEGWIQFYNRKTGNYNNKVIPVLVGHTIIFIVLGTATFVSAYFVVGDWWGPVLFGLAILTLLPGISSLLSQKS